jgi:fucose 4-O-acetylase-like acetyltransferase
MITEAPGGLPIPTDPSTHYIFDLLVHFIYSFRMPLFMVLAGFFTSLLLAKRGLQGTFINRGKRILGPLLVSCLTILPLTLLLFEGFVFITPHPPNCLC